MDHWGFRALIGATGMNPGGRSSTEALVGGVLGPRVTRSRRSWVGRGLVLAGGGAEPAGSVLVERVDGAMGLPRADWSDGEERGREELDGGVPASRATGKGRESSVAGWVVLALEALVPRGASAVGPLAGALYPATCNRGRSAPTRSTNTTTHTNTYTTGWT